MYGNYYFFNGYTGAKIFRDPKLSKWKMVGQSISSKFATCDVDDYPFGTQVWKLNEDDRNMTLNLNGCYDDWHFNCQDGSCIDSAARWVRSWYTLYVLIFVRWHSNDMRGLVSTFSEKR